MIQTTRVCEICKSLIVLEEKNFVEKGKAYRHYECHVQRLMTMKRNPYPENEARKLADELKEKSIKKVDELVMKNHLYSWLQRKYDIVTMPSYIFIKFEDIFKGQYKGMSRPIPPEDMLDMFQRQWDNLCSYYSYNQSKGKTMDEVGRLNYDIAVILGKSTSYYAWKDTQKSKEESLKELATERKINFEAIASKPKCSSDEDYIIEDEEET